MKKVFTTLLAAAALGAFMNTAQAAYPDRPIRIIVPFAPGGIADTTARMIAADIGAQLGQPVIVENRPGGAAIIGAGAVARSKPDGYTLLMATTNISTNPSLYKTLPYDADKDLTPVALTMTIPAVIIVNPTLPVKTFPQLLSYAKEHPGNLSYASVGEGSFPHLTIEGLSQKTSIKMLHVPYKGLAPAITAVLTGEVNLMASDVPGALPYVRAGKVRALATTGSKRIAELSDIPTLQEEGIVGYEAVGWLGLMAPAGTPKKVIDLLNDTVNKAMQKPKIGNFFSSQGVDVVVTNPAKFKTFLDTNRAGWDKVIKAANIAQREN